jgi:integrase
MAFLADAAVPGLGVIWGSKGRPSWTFAYRVRQPDGENKQFRMKLGFASHETTAQPGWLTIDQARAKAYSIKEAGKVGQVVQTAKPTSTAAQKRFEDVLSDYLNAKAPRSRSDIDRMIRKDCAALLARPVASITYQETDAIIQTVIDRGSKIAARNLYLTLTAIFNWAHKRRLIPEVPMMGEAPAASKPRDRILTDCELAKIWRATADRPAPLRGIIRTLILTGQRREEVASMRWSQIDETEKVWTIAMDDFKTGAMQFLPLNTVSPILGEQQRIAGSDFVFTFDGSKSANMSKEGGVLAKLSGVVDWTLHDLRRTARTNWSKLRIDPEIRERLIHPATGIKGTYDRYDFLDEKRAALSTWAEYVAKIVGE